jgi:uncharacterized phage protein gp47/JayE
LAVETYQTIRDRILADIDAEMAASGSTRGVVEYALACALAGACLLLHAAINRAARDRVPSTSRPGYLRQWAAFFGIAPKAATNNVGSATFAATAASSIPGGTALRLRDGTEFTTDALASESGGSITVDFTATVAGAAGAAIAGTAIFLGSPVPGVTSEGVVGVGGIGGGADVESTASVLARLLARLRNPPGGGTDADWERWTKGTPGVEVDRVWIYPNTLGPSSMRVLFTVVGDDPIPVGEQVDAVTAELALRKPADLLTCQAQAPVAQALNPSMTLVPLTAPVQTAATAAMRAFLNEEMEPGTTMLISELNAAISGATGETDHTMISPVANVTALSQYHLIVLGTPAYS